MKIEVDLEPYYEWYSKWINWMEVTPDDIKNGKKGIQPFNMFDEWLEAQSLNITDAIGKTVYFSVNSVTENELTYDTFHEGCNIKKGIITKIEHNKVWIDNKCYCMPYDPSGYFFANKEYAILSLHYDGDSIFEGNELKACFPEDLFTVKC